MSVMSLPSDVIISDTSCLIALNQIHAMPILHQLFGKVIVTEEVASECGYELPNWVEIRTVANRQKQRELELSLDLGEASAITLALEIPNAVLIIDEYKGRKVALHAGLRIIGTVGVLLLAKKAGLIPLVKPYLEQLEEVNFRLSDALIEKALKDVGE
jgi:predicted nucleic acid-binding protein